ncbi:MAG TPA: SRPBCC domain-containing protein [Candidatus Saccharimonadales bacterium]|nr:SRPBCC domain-containing protein [Candidatus Saccharimonadales bacterium]
MNDQNFTLTINVNKPASEVYKAITNVRDWWSQEVEGDTDKQGAVFYYHYKDLHNCVLKVADLQPSKKVVWHVLYNHFSFVKDEKEWTGDEIVFEINEKGDKTEVKFTHFGLTPKYECYGACSEGWGNYILGSLKDLIETGKGEPNVGEAQTKSEAKHEK